MMPVLCLSQGGHYGGNNQDIEQICKILQKNNFSSNTAAEEALNKILSVIGAAKNFALYQCSDIENCAAITYNGDRYILYDGDFMDVIKNTSNSWSNLSILAHEIGHHINGHTIDIKVYSSGSRDAPSLEKKRKQELEADEYSGFVMYKLGASLEEAKAAINLISFDGDDTFSTHPNKSKRIRAIEKGFNSAKNLSNKDLKIISPRKKIYSIEELDMPKVFLTIRTADETAPDNQKDCYHPYLDIKKRVVLKSTGEFFTGTIKGHKKSPFSGFSDRYDYLVEEYVNGVRHNFEYFYKGIRIHSCDVDNFGNGEEKIYNLDGKLKAIYKISDNFRDGIAKVRLDGRKQEVSMEKWQNGFLIEKESNHFHWDGNRNKMVLKYYYDCRKLIKEESYFLSSGDYYLVSHQIYDDYSNIIEEKSYLKGEYTPLSDLIKLYSLFPFLEQ